MKRFIFMVQAMCLACCCVLAQNTKSVKGKVVDNNGVPVMGAIVEYAGGNGVLTDIDGAFNLSMPKDVDVLSVSCVGLKHTRIKLADDLDLSIRLKPLNKSSWFVNFEVSLYQRGDNEAPQCGVMAGYIGNWGGYVKYLQSETLSVTAGCIRKLYDPIHLYVGAGAFKDNYDKYNFMYDIGLLFRLTDHYTFNVGYSTGKNYIKERVHEAHFGLGYVF